ncbi:MAG: ribbon-helix-helix domain-containing protein [Cyanobacteria bacterium J06621_12]
MATKSINITIEEAILIESDRLVASGKYTNRSRFIEEAIQLRLKQLDAEFIGEQSKLLNPDEAEEWFEGEVELWQE